MWRFADGVREDAIEHDQWLKENTAVYSVEIPANIDTLSINRNSKKIVHLLKLPADSITLVNIYDTILSFPISYPDAKKMKPLFTEQNLKNDSIEIDISILTKKVYTLSYYSSNRKGYYPLVIN